LEKRRHGLDRIGRMLGNRSCPMSNPDADLLSLGVRLFEAEAEAVRADAAFDEIHNQILENVETVATWPADAEQWTAAPRSKCQHASPIPAAKQGSGIAAFALRMVGLP